MPRPNNGPKLPQSLLKQVQDGDTNTESDSKSRYVNSAPNRTGRRQYDQVNRKLSAGGRSSSERKRYRDTSKSRNGPFRTKDKPVAFKKEPENDSESDISSDDQNNQTENIPPSRQKRKIDAEEDNIAALEKKLGIRGKKRSKPDDYGLDALLGSDSEEAEKQKESLRRSPKLLKVDEDWLEEKRKNAKSAAHKTANLAELTSPGDTSDSMVASEDFSGLSESDIDSNGSITNSDDDQRNVEYSSNPKLQLSTSRKQRENPYLPPTGLLDQRTKYIPPSLRKSTADKNVDLQLHRTIKGQLNRLSESSLISILQKIAEIYQNNPRQSVTNILVEMLDQIVNDRASLSDSFILLHAGFSAALFKTIGPEFGAQLIGNFVERFDDAYDPDTHDTTDKRPHNIIAFISQLYNLQVVTCEILFDYIRFFLHTISETNTELLLRIVRSSGSSLRQDDPSALRDIILQLHKKTSEQDLHSISVRTKFMIETMEKLKDNRLKTGAEASTVLAEQLVRMKKFLGTWKNNKTLRGTEPLRLTLTDARSADKRGNWWLKTALKDSEEVAKDRFVVTEIRAEKKNPLPLDMDDDDFSPPDLKNLSRQYGMNTDVRRAIFVAILSATDCEDACEKIHKLRLSKSQRNEIPLVVVRCSIAESDAFNPYYGLLAQRLCATSKLGIGFQFQLWDVLRAIENGESLFHDDTLENHHRGFTMSQVSNLSRLYGFLILRGGLDITVLKNLELASLDLQVKLFVENLLVTILLGKHDRQEAGQKAMQKLERALVPARRLPTFATGLRWFLANIVAKSDLVSAKDLKLIKLRCKDAIELLTE